MSASPNVLTQPAAMIFSIGPKRAAALAEAGVRTVQDLLYYFPRRHLDRSTVKPIRDLREEEVATVVGRIVQTKILGGRKSRFQLVLSDGTSMLTCVWFANPRLWQHMFEPGEWLAVSGKVTRYGSLQMAHPEFDRLGDDKEGAAYHTGKIVPVYPSGEALTAVGLDSRGFRRLLTKVVEEFADDADEMLSTEMLMRLELMPLAEALRAVHFPANFDQLQAARRRLKFDELFFLQLMLALRRRRCSQQSDGISFERVGDRVKALVSLLPFELTEAQKRVLHEIRADMKSSRPMNRLLQGDVGSGKTIVALIAMLIAVENGYQAALMAPTEILAEQHYLTVFRLLEALEVRTVLLIGKQNQSLRQRILAEIASGAAQIVVGTHALIQEGVRFARLGLAIVDEQHRFGVMQRATLREKGVNPDLLVMTATPIPRTLAMTVYGDLDVSILDQLPAGRRPIVTSYRSEGSRMQIYDFVRRKVTEGDQAYIVFPLVEESEKLDLKAATESYETLRATLFKGFSLGLLHGRMKSEEKDAVMAAFKRGEIQILVSTTVVEVGVDVPNASIMVIEHAERFGLTQLHQLRGRVGRGAKQSYCILIAYGPLSVEARERLTTMAETNDGFKIAEKDLQLRGPGDYFGTQQSGLPDFKIADILTDGDLLTLARQEAFRLVERDPKLAAAVALNTRGYFSRRYRGHYELSWVG